MNLSAVRQRALGIFYALHYKGRVKRYHRSIMVKEVVEILGVRQGFEMMDLTFGEGGHTEAFFEAGAAKIYASDRDSEAIDNYLDGGPYARDPRLVIRWGAASDFANTFPNIAPNSLDAAFLDLGVSTWQVLDSSRGFSFSYPGPLDMRMDRKQGKKLQDRLRHADFDEIVQALTMADIYPADKLARQILAAAADGKITNTDDLAAFSEGGGKRHPATQLFLALRMWLNDELGEVERCLPQLVDALKIGGRLGVLTFHSTEDRLVKRAFQRLAGKCVCQEPLCICERVKKVEWILKKALPPSPAEISQNARSRSAKFRCVEKCEATVYTKSK